ncbi:histidine kinase [Streptomyces sp. CAU 1734]|uniref:sensor histidine kinase n=1 Tax=Streptomyces sp. CAU 1734 TaxID=3140360 RepID=UPI003260864E
MTAMKAAEPAPAAGVRTRAAAARPRIGERILAAAGRDPLAAPRRTRNDAYIAAGAAVLSILLGGPAGQGSAPAPLGWALLAGAVAALTRRRSRPGPVLAAVLICVLPYHLLDYNHIAAAPASVVAQYTVAATTRPLRAFLIGGGTVLLAVLVMFTVGVHEGVETLRTSGWIMAVIVVGVQVRTYRHYIASVVARAEHAERTREEEAARRVAEERIRIARDLHDLLAHSITLIGVRTAVASHILTVDPGRLDRTAVAAALDEIAETCRAARGELRTTLDVLRTDTDTDPGPGTPDTAPGGDPAGPLPGLDALPELARAARAELTLNTGGAPVPAPVAVTAYRIVQESLTNAVRHGGPGVRIAVSVVRRDPHLRVAVTDNGGGPAPGGGSGHGITGMRERARSVGGTLTAGPGNDGGFEVSALLPLRPAGDPA